MIEMTNKTQAQRAYGVVLAPEGVLAGFG